jgi:DNA/RNA-binding domain of Phe-tRNA-synthetase-like protein
MHLSPEVEEKFPGIAAALAKVDELTVSQTQQLTIHPSFTMEELAEMKEIKAYRTFMWKVGIDPEKRLPPPEAILRQAIEEGAIPGVNTLVDSCNLVSARHGVPIAAMDSSKVKEGLVLRMAQSGESFNTGGEKKALAGTELVLADAEKAIYLYPYENCDETKVTLETKECMLLACGVPGIDKSQVVACIEEAYRKVIENCGGHYKGVVVLG